MLNDLPGGSDCIVERINNTPLERDMAEAMMSFLERLINIDDS